MKKNSHVTELDDKNLTGLVAGTGKQPVVFIHGSPANAMRWAQYLEVVPDGYQFLSIDRMGFGSRGAQEPDLEADYKLVSEYIAGLENPIVVAHSLGGALALRLASECSLKKLILVACSLNPDLKKVSWIQKLGAINPFCFILSRSIRHSNDEMLQLPRFMRETERKLKPLSCSACVVHPKDDSLVSYENAAYAQKYIDNIDVIVPETGGHFIPWTHVDLILGVIKGRLFSGF